MKNKQDNAIITLLKLSRVDRIICDTDKGLLKLCTRKGESNYFFTLDATELDKNTNKELMELLFPVISVVSAREVKDEDILTLHTKHSYINKKPKVNKVKKNDRAKAKT